MKKTKVLAAVLIASTMLIGAGYAAWTDKLTINNTVQTGELNVEFMDQGNYPRAEAWSYVGGVAKDTGEKSYIKAKIDHISSKEEKVTISNMYPGSMAFYEAMIKNTGTIPAVVDNVKVQFSEDTKDTMKNTLDAYGGIVYHQKQADGSYVEVKEKGRAFYGKLGDLEKNLNDAVKDLRIEPEDYITFDIPEERRGEIGGKMGIELPDGENCIQFWLPYEAGDDLEKQNAEFDIAINFKQHNVNVAK